MIEWCGYKWDVSMEGGRLIHPDKPWMWYDKGQVCIDADNQLHLLLQEKPTVIQYWDGTVYHPTIATGVVRTEVPLGPGVFSADIKLPKGKNLWASFWLTGCRTWPPEIDICEAETGDCGTYFRLTRPQFPWLWPGWQTTSNIHWNGIDDDGDYVHKQTGSRQVPLCKQWHDPSDIFINYRCEWTNNEIRILVNDNLVRSVKGDIPNMVYNNTSDPRQYVVLN